MLPDRVLRYDGSPNFHQGTYTGGRFAVVGTGPGGVDVARYLIDSKLTLLPVDMVSRQGRLSKVQTLNPPMCSFELEVESLVQKIEELGIEDLNQMFEAFHVLFRKADEE